MPPLPLDSLCLSPTHTYWVCAPPPPQHFHLLTITPYLIPHNTHLPCLLYSHILTLLHLLFSLCLFLHSPPHPTWLSTLPITHQPPTPNSTFTPLSHPTPSAHPIPPHLVPPIAYLPRPNMTLQMGEVSDKTQVFIQLYIY